MLLPPEVEETAIAQSKALGRMHAQSIRDAVNPVGRAFEFRIVADRSFVHHAMAPAVPPLGPPFLVAKCSHQAKRTKDFRQRISVGDLRLGFNAVFMAVLAGTGVRQTLVRELPFASVVADAQNLGARAHLAVGSVVENVVFKAACRLQAKTCRLQPAAEIVKVGYPKFDLGLNSHGYQQVYGQRWLWRCSGSDNTRVKTLRLTVDPDHPWTPESQQALDQAAGILRAGGLVALPTETVYGLGANALDKTAVERIFTAKRRPAWDPIIVHIASEAMLKGLAAEVPAAATLLIQAFWPGPLTLLLPRASAIPDAVTAGRPLVGIRMPAHPIALELIGRAGVPIAAPSANLFSRTSPTTAAHVLEDLDGRIDAVLDAGPTAHGVESTVLDPGMSPIVMYRPGAITAEQIREIAGPVELYGIGEKLVETSPGALPSPGVGLRHYAPRAKLILLDEPLPHLKSMLAETARNWRGERLGVMLPAEVVLPQELATAKVFAWGRWAAPEEMARSLYAGLRALDAQECSVILCPLPPDKGLGVAIRDRLRKAAHSKWS